jgi:hypothetical protein
MTYKATMTHKKVPLSLAILEAAMENCRKFRRETAKGKSQTQILAEIITNPAAQVVIGIWPDETQPDGVGARVVKGDLQIERVLSGDIIQFDAIWCRHREEAEAMRQTLGEDRPALN